MEIVTFWCVDKCCRAEGALRNASLRNTHVNNNQLTLWSTAASQLAGSHSQLTAFSIARWTSPPSSSTRLNISSSMLLLIDGFKISRSCCDFMAIINTWKLSSVSPSPRPSCSGSGSSIIKVTTNVECGSMIWKKDDVGICDHRHGKRKPRHEWGLAGVIQTPT